MAVITTESENKIITVFVAAASPIVRAGLEALLESSENLVVAGSGADIFAAATLPASSIVETVNVLLINVEEARDLDDLLEFISDGAEEADPPAVAVLFSPELFNSGEMIRALRGGVRGILPHHAAGHEIKAAVTASASGLINLVPEILENILTAGTTSDQNSLLVGGVQGEELASARASGLVEILTPRETEILELLSEGTSNKSIAYQLDISEHTVKFHVASIFGKLGVGTRTEAVMQGIKRGLILL